ncbi:hypothetical protein P152DRAFT_475217 [Eremomyces bilateralis CBS 781.70]|uniref:Nudix hydrolase domain-containing protein n=1 Tax=Eremomyces bilateralis CBS 781.70 TaxID=1392243 RepID=A0A6G1FXZ8_9PEZI|nr:uncharacterized protein P152DRAFT_475217 [Eremomyces bilateralis CBS 781.70]KAF1810755.1 hypothetical protein P152DRAFT_475217 [Eremomyces bilateralis CBS 781.70]
MSQAKAMYKDGAEKPKKAPPVPRPSASVLLLSPDNQVLLLRRVRTSSSFPSAHVFPGGNVSAAHDGLVPDPLHPDRHRDGPAYRLAAIRETFEESGILLARDPTGRLIEVPEAEREQARKDIYAGKVKFVDWVRAKGGEPDTEGLVPYTRWVTPTGVPKRFTTQMYLYFLPVATAGAGGIGPLATEKDVVIPTPTHDGGVEHTAARFLAADKWLAMAASGEIIVFPPQVFLLFHVARFLAGRGAEEGRRRLVEWVVREGDLGVAWKDKVISPDRMGGVVAKDGRAVLSLATPGLELKGSERKGTAEWVVFVGFSKEGPRKVEVKTKEEALKEIKGELKL